MFYWIFEYVWMFFRLSALFHRCIKHIFTNAHKIKGFVCPALSTSRAILIHAPNARRTPGTLPEVFPLCNFYSRASYEARLSLICPAARAA